MYDKVAYSLISQDYLFDRLMETPEGRALFLFRCATFAICLISILVSFILYRKAKCDSPGLIPQTDEPEKRRSEERTVLGISLAVLGAIFALHSFTVLEYMDFAYLYEAEFSSFKEFILKRQYVSNSHLPGYYLPVFIARNIFGDSRTAIISINFLAVGISIIPFYRLCRKNMEHAGAMSATLAYLASPMIVYSLYRISPYMLLAVGHILAVYFFLLFTETGGKRYFGYFIVSIIACVSLHMLAYLTVFLLLLAILFYRKNSFRENRGELMLFLALGTVFAGMVAFNSAPLVFNSVFASVSLPIQIKNHVLFDYPGGTIPFVFYLSRMILNVYFSFLSTNVFPAVVSGFLLVTGVLCLSARGKYPALFVLPGAGSIVLIVAIIVISHGTLRGYPMTYRHFAILAPFFIYLVFSASQYIGNIIAEKTGVGLAEKALPVLLCLLYIGHVPSVVNALRSPDYDPALEFVFDRVEENDGVITGNMFFFNEHVNYFRRNNSGYSLDQQLQAGSPEWPREEYVANQTVWYNVKSPKREEVKNVLMNLSSYNMEMRNAVRNNFLERIWYIDNDTRRFGVFPDFSGKYKAEVRESLAGMKEIARHDFRGISVVIYETDPSPEMWDEKGTLTIVAGENDYYYLRGVRPEVLLDSKEREINPDSEMMVVLPENTSKVDVSFLSADGIPGGESPVTDLFASEKIYSGTDGSGGGIYSIPVSPGQHSLHLGFRDFGRKKYSKIILKAYK